MIYRRVYNRTDDLCMCVCMCVWEVGVVRKELENTFDIKWISGRSLHQ